MLVGSASAVKVVICYMPGVGESIAAGVNKRHHATDAATQLNRGMFAHVVTMCCGRSRVAGTCRRRIHYLSFRMVFFWR